jgi:glycine/D-amino acid oxidase-like deaminating enzyme
MKRTEMSSEVPHSADVVVVGGGVFGCSAALHLMQAGAGKVVLIERTTGVARQTAYAGAGFVSLWSAGDAQPEYEIEQYGRAFYQSDQTLMHDPQIITRAAQMMQHDADRDNDLPDDVCELPNDIALFNQFAAQMLAAAIPALGKFQIKETRHGLPVRTPELLAELIVQGKTSADIAPLSMNRFGGGYG